MNSVLLAHETLFYMEFVVSYHNQIYHQATPDFLEALSGLSKLVDFDEEFFSPCSVHKFPVLRKDGWLIHMLRFPMRD